MDAKAHHAQLTKRIEAKNYVGAAYDCVRAGSGYAKAGAEANMQKILTLSIKNVLPNLTSSDLDKNDNIPEKFETFLDHVNKFNENGRYVDEISAIRQSIKEAKVRK